MILKLNDLSDNEEFFDLLSKFRNKFDEVVDISKGRLQKNYLLQYNFEFNNDVKRIADTFVDVVTKYLGTLPVLDSFQMWYSPNNDEELIGSKLFHRDPEDFKQIKIFIPIDEITTDNGPLRVIDKNQSKFLYDNLIKTGVIKKRNQKIDDDQLLQYKITDNKKLF